MKKLLVVIGLSQCLFGADTTFSGGPISSSSITDASEAGKFSLTNALPANRTRIIANVNAFPLSLQEQSQPAQTFTTRVRWYSPSGGRNPRLVFVMASRTITGSYYSEGNVTSCAAFSTLKASLEDSNGRRWLAQFNGARSSAPGTNAFLISDPLPVSLAAGSRGWLVTYCDVGATATKFPAKTQTHGGALGTGAYNYGTGEGVVTGQDYSEGTTAVSASYTYGFSPVTIIGESDSKLPSIIYIGDSIMAGSSAGGMILDAWYGGGSWVHKASWATVPFVGVGIGTDAYTNLLSTVYPYDFHRASLAKYADVVVLGMGINDIIAGGYTTNTLMYMATNVASFYANQQKRVYQTTILPWVTSTDSLRTLENQTPSASYETNRVTFNDWIRTVPYPFSGYLEIADAVETGRNTGYWKNPVGTNEVASITTGTGIDINGQLFDAGKSWTANQWIGYSLQTLSGTTNVISTIYSNTSTILRSGFSSHAAGDNYWVWKLWSRDGVHPTDYGCSIIAATLDPTKW